MPGALNLSRRDVLKLLGVLAASAPIAGLISRATRSLTSTKPNIIIILFDAMSARHLSLYGYGRDTTPNLIKFAERATVYHSHYSAGSFTTSGTASLLTGLHPWTHRAINLGGLVQRSLAGHNIFQLIGDEYFKIAFAQNVWADLFLHQFQTDVNAHIPISSFSYKPKALEFASDLKNDSLMAHFAADEFLSLNYKELNPLPGSLTLGAWSALMNQTTRQLSAPSAEYPYGMPYNSLSFYYENHTVFQGVREVIEKNTKNSPILGYFHLFSPHAPYTPTRRYTDVFPEIKVPFKPAHPLSYMHYKQRDLNELRLHYDECVANVDAEFGNLINGLKAAGILDNSYVIITSDHGEVFERGEVGHGTALLYTPVIHIPLLISAPHQVQRRDVFSPTNSVDIVPTVLKIAGHELPATIEGRLLPDVGDLGDLNRSIYSMEAKMCSAFGPLHTSTVSLIKDRFHLIYYRGYEKYSDVYELYDLDEDNEERKNIFSPDFARASLLKEELLDILADADRPFLRN